MPGRRTKKPEVTIRWETDRRTGEVRRDETGRAYALLRWRENGKRMSRPAGYCTPEEAQTAADRQAAALLLGVELANGSPRRWTVAAVVDEYLDDLEGRLGEDAEYLTNETNRLVYVKDLLGTIAAEHLTTKRLQNYAHARAREVTRLGTTTKRKSIVEEINSLRRAVACVRALGFPVPEPPPPPNLKALPDDARPARRLTEQEVAAIVTSASVAGGWVEGMGSMIATMAWSGRRPIAIFHARREHCVRVVDDTLPRAQRLMFWERDKGGIGRGWGPLTEPAYLAIRERYEETKHLPPDALLWARYHGDVWDSEALSRPFDRIEEVAGVKDVQPYDLRRFACTHILRALGNDMRAALTYTGHRTIQTLLRYVYAEVEEAESMAEGIGWTPESETTRAGELRVVEGGKGKPRRGE
jgi:integrase